MSIQRIDHAPSRTHGWQIRAYTQWPRYVSRFFADRAHGGKRKAKAKAQAEHDSLVMRAAMVRRAGGKR